MDPIPHDPARTAHNDACLAFGPLELKALKEEVNEVLSRFAQDGSLRGLVCGPRVSCYQTLSAVDMDGDRDIIIRLDGVSPSEHNLPAMLNTAIDVKLPYGYAVDCEW